jgi:hypothetical protein
LQQLAGLFPAFDASLNVGYPTLFLSLIRFAFPQLALWKTVLRFEAKKGAESGGTVSESSPEPLEVLDVNSDSAGVFFKAVFVRFAGQASPCLE